jgi:pSer/pThr/pTyr-binding forkhead associated (FHA) protein
MARKAAKRRKTAPRSQVSLRAEDADLVSRLAERVGLPPREVIERALATYSAAVAPGMPVVPAPPAGSNRRGARKRLFVSVEGRAEVEIKKSEFVFGRDPSSDVALDVPLVSPRHARVLFRDGEPVFEDLQSQRGTYQHGEKIDVKPIRDGDEFDLGGFVTVRFRLAAKDL